MAHGQSKLYGTGSVAEAGDVTQTAVLTRGNLFCERESQREINTLRSINAHLVREIALLKEREAQTQRLADRDGLTGLYNRRRMLDLLTAAISEASRSRRQVALLFIDLDGFKGVNDEHGHAAGDKLLITAASRLSACVRTGDVVCRYGGDEFVVILTDVPDAAAVARVAGTIRARIALPYRISGKDLQVTAAIGIALCPAEGQNAAALLERADQNMYREKATAASRSLRYRETHPGRRSDDKVPNLTL